jgi:hypothetical protein
MTRPSGWPYGRIEANIARKLDEHTSPRKAGIVLGSSAGIDLPSGDTVESGVSSISAERLAAGTPPGAGQVPRRRLGSSGRARCGKLG